MLLTKSMCQVFRKPALWQDLNSKDASIGHSGLTCSLKGVTGKELVAKAPLALDLVGPVLGLVTANWGGSLAASLACACPDCAHIAFGLKIWTWVPGLGLTASTGSSSADDGKLQPSEDEELQHQDAFFAFSLVAVSAEDKHSTPDHLRYSLQLDRLWRVPNLH